MPIANPLAVALALSSPVIVAGAFGWFNGMLITRYSIQPIVATLVLFIAGRGIAQVMTNGNLQVFRNDAFQFIALGRIFGIPVAGHHHGGGGRGRGLPDPPHRRSAGRSSRSAATRRRRGSPASRPSGSSGWSMCSSGALAGIAGLIVVARNSASDANLVGLGMELDAIAAVAVGGTLLIGGRANILGTLLGACVIQLVRYTLLANGVPDAAALVVKAGLIIAAVFIQQRADRG